MKPSGKEIINILLVEDNPVDAHLAQERLKRCQIYQCKTTLVDSMARAEKQLAKEIPDAILLDLGLPDSDGLETYFKISEIAPQVPVVILSALENQDLAIQAISNGAKDYLIKSPDSYQYLDRAIRYAVEAGWVALKITEGTERIKLASQAAIRLSDISVDEDLHTLIAEQLKELSGAMFSGVSRFNPDTSTFTLQEMAGTPKLMQQILNSLRMPLIGFEYNLSDEIMAALKAGHPQHVADLVEGMGYADIPRTVVKKAIAALGIGEMIIMPLHSSGRLVGLCNSVFARNQKPGQTTIEIMGIFASAAAIALQRRQTHRQLAESEKKYRSLVEGGNDGIVIIQDGLITYANARMAEMGGRSPKEVTGTPFTDHIAPEYHSTVADHYAAIMADDEVHTEFEIQLLSPQGQRTMVEINVSLIEHGGQPAFMALVRDISEREKAEEALRRKNASQRLLQIVAVAANEATDVEQALASVLKEVCDHTGWPIGHVYIPADDSSGQLRPTTIWQLRQPERFEAFKRVTEKTTFDPGIGLPGRVYSSGKPAWIIDVTKDTNFPRAQLATDIGVKAGFGFPVLVGTEVVAVLEFFSPEAVEPDQTLLDIMANVGTQLGRVFERQQAIDKTEAVATELRQLIETANAPIIGIDRDGMVNEWNQSAEAMTGFTKDDVMGYDLVETRISEDYREAVKNVLDKALQGEETANYEFPMFTRQGGQVKILLSASTRRDVDGNIVGVLGIGQDITELDKYRAGLEQMVEVRTAELNLALTETELARGRIDGILKSIGDGLIVTDLHNRVVLMNRAVEDMLGVRLSEVLDQPIELAIKEASLREQIVTTLGKKMTGYSFDFELPDAESEHPRIMRARTSVIFNRDGQQSGIITIIHDVSHEREVDRLKTEFISTAAHELRTPLTSIQGFSEILMTRDDLEDGERIKFLGHINRQASALTDIVNDLLDISRIESGRGFALNLSECDAGAALRSVVEPFMSRSKRHSFKVSLPKKSQQLIVDKDKMAQALENLVSNAVKYSPAGGEIKVSGRVKQGWYEIIVEDAGIGMTAEELDHIYDKFYRANSSDIAIEGTGLGMSIVKAIVDAHGGKIAIMSEAGAGTKVTVSLPIPVDGPSGDEMTKEMEGNTKLDAV